MSNDDNHDSTKDRPHHHGLVGDEQTNLKKINYIITLVTDTLVENCIEFDINLFLALTSVLVTNIEMQDRCVTNIIDAVYDNLDRQIKNGTLKSEMLTIKRPM